MKPDNNNTVDHDALELVEEALTNGGELTLEDVGSVFGQPFWVLLVMALMDANDAARAIQLATQRLRHNIHDDDAISWDDEEDDDRDQ